VDAGVGELAGEAVDGVAAHGSGGDDDAGAPRLARQLEELRHTSQHRDLVIE
jgi:hypothetical protein